MDGQESDYLRKMRVKIILNHVENTLSSFICPQCLLTYSSRGHLNIQLSTVSFDALLWDEKICRKYFCSGQISKIRVKRDRHERRLWGASFQFPDGLQRHVNIVHGMSWNTLSCERVNWSGANKKHSIYSFMLFLESEASIRVRFLWCSLCNEVPSFKLQCYACSQNSLVAQRHTPLLVINIPVYDGTAL